MNTCPCTDLNKTFAKISYSVSMLVVVKLSLILCPLVIIDYDVDSIFYLLIKDNFCSLAALAAAPPSLP